MVKLKRMKEIYSKKFEVIIIINKKNVILLNKNNNYYKF